MGKGTSNRLLGIMWTCAVFTLGRNMFSLITNGTCSTMKIVTSPANHDRNLLTMIIIETTSRRNFDLSRTECFSANVVSPSRNALPFVSEELEK